MASVGNVKGQHTILDKIYLANPGIEVVWINRNLKNAPRYAKLFHGLSEKAMFQLLSTCTHIVSAHQRMVSSGAKILAPSALCELLRPCQDAWCDESVYDTIVGDTFDGKLTMPDFDELERRRDAIVARNEKTVVKECQRILESTVEVTNTSSIQKVIHVMWLSPEDVEDGYVPRKYRENLRNLKILNEPKYKVIVHNNRTVQKALKEFSPEVYDFWSRLPLTISKCDLARFVVVYLTGGYYCDLDFYHVQSFDKLPSENPLVFRELIEHEKSVPQLFNGFFGASRGNDFIHDWIMQMTRLDPEQISKPGKVLSTTGPIAFWQFYEEYHINAKRKETKSSVKLSNPMAVMPLTNQRKISKEFDGSIPVVAYTCWDEGSMWGISNHSYKNPALIVVCVLCIVLFVTSLTFFTAMLYRKRNKI